MEKVIDGTWTNGSDCVPIKCYLWALKFECQVISMLQSIILLLIFSQPFKGVKITLSMGAVQKQVADY